MAADRLAGLSMAGKTCLVTGGAGSIGRASAAALLARGANVMLVDRDAAGLAEAATSLGGGVATLAADVTKAKEAAGYKERAPRGIRVNSLHPGPVENGFQSRIERDLDGILGGGATAFLNQAIPLRRHADPAEIADAVLYLACDMSRFVTGTAMAIDGGMSL